jgi:hypothetical protein
VVFSQIINDWRIEMSFSKYKKLTNVVGFIGIGFVSMVASAAIANAL